MRELLLSAVLDRLGVDVRPAALYSVCGAHIVCMTCTQQLPPGGVGELIDRQRVWCRETFAPIQIQDKCDELFKVHSPLVQATIALSLTTHL